VEETKYCTICKQTKDLKKFTLNDDGSVRKHVCKSCYSSKWRAQLKLEMLEVFGGKCQCCGEDNPHFLTLDHRLNDGNKHRSEANSGSVEVIYSSAKKEGWPKERYQLLCMNCNWAKGKFGQCPHQSDMTKEKVYESLRSRIFHTGKSLQEYNYEPLKLGPLSQKLSEDQRHANRLATYKKYNETHREERLAHKKEYRDANREKVNAQNQEYRRKSMISQSIAQLTPEQAMLLIAQLQKGV
jgi:hypothetical protein